MLTASKLGLICALCKTNKRIEKAAVAPLPKPVIPELAESLGRGVTNLAYHIDPKLKEWILRLAGGASNPAAEKTIGYMTPAIALGTTYGLKGLDDSEPAPQMPPYFDPRLVQGRVNPGF
jgi:hypothetical protein